jgi:hypothetical protein
VHAKFNYTYPNYSITSRFFKKLILENVGLFLVYQNNLLLKKQFIFNRSQFKKQLFSFVYPEVEKKSLLLRKKKTTLKELLKNASKNISFSKNFSYGNIKKLYLKTKVLLRKNYTQPTNSFLQNYSPSYIDILNPFHHKTKGSDNRYLFTLREVKLGRIRFKPGYQKL